MLKENEETKVSVGTKVVEEDGSTRDLGRILVDDNSNFGVCFPFYIGIVTACRGGGSTHMQRLVCKGGCVCVCVLEGGHSRAFSQWYEIACLHAHAR